MLLLRANKVVAYRLVVVRHDNILGSWPVSVARLSLAQFAPLHAWNGIVQCGVHGSLRWVNAAARIVETVLN